MASREYTDAQLHEGYELNRYTIQPDAEDASKSNIIRDESILDAGTHFSSYDIIDVGILECDHVKNGTVHELSNPNPTVKNFRFIATAPCASTDTFEFNGDPVATSSQPSFSAGEAVIGVLVEGALHFTQSYLGIPIGAMMAYASDIIPPGWLLCDGAAVSRTEYPTLFDRVGTNYGAGDGSTTFNVPDKNLAPYEVDNWIIKAL